MNRRGFARIAWTGLLAQNFSTARGQGKRESALLLPNYSALRSYTGDVEEVNISDLGTGGNFRRAGIDNSMLDNGGTIIVDGKGRRWRRMDVQRIDFRWFGATGGPDDSSSVQIALDAEKGKTFLVPKGFDA